MIVKIFADRGTPYGTILCEISFWSDDMKRYYVYEWFNKSNNYIFYVGKGCGNRCSRIQGRNKTFFEIYRRKWLYQKQEY